MAERSQGHNRSQGHDRIEAQVSGPFTTMAAPGEGRPLVSAPQGHRASRLFGFVPRGFLPLPLVLARWLAYVLATVLAGIAVLLAAGFWARHRVLKT
jgi:hypothetical protein